MEYAFLKDDYFKLKEEYTEKNDSFVFIKKQSCNGLKIKNNNYPYWIFSSTSKKQLTKYIDWVNNYQECYPYILKETNKNNYKNNYKKENIILMLAIKNTEKEVEKEVKKEVKKEVEKEYFNKKVSYVYIGIFLAVIYFIKK